MTLVDLIQKAIGPDSTPDERRAAFIQALQSRNDSDATREAVDILSTTQPVKAAGAPPLAPAQGPGQGRAA